MTATAAARWRAFFCVVCGHVEWVAEGCELPADWRCPLCGEGRAVLLAADDPRFARHAITAQAVARGVWSWQKQPPFRADWAHQAFVLQHQDGLVLCDAPPAWPTPANVAAVQALGTPALLVVGHADFLGAAMPWAEALAVPVWAGEGELPLPGNRLAPKQRVAGTSTWRPGLSVVRVPGHTPGSLAVRWYDAPDGAVTFTGDAVGVFEHEGGRMQVACMQEPPVGPALRDLLARPTELLLTNMGVLRQPGPVLQELLQLGDRACCRPYRGETGGAWR